MRRPAPIAVAEDAINRVLNAVLSRRGWQPTIAAHRGYGGPGFVRVLARVLMTDVDDQPIRTDGAPRSARRRGWRSFLTAEVPRAEVLVEIAGTTHRTRADRSGHVDLRVPNPGLPAGWSRVTLSLADTPGRRTTAEVMIVPDGETLGIISDVDDTVLSTGVPRPLLALYNTLVLRGSARRPVAGMAALLTGLRRGHPLSPVWYVSTGAWNVESMLRGFIDRNGYPKGPLLLTDWGPTSSGWFRSGQEHKRDTIAELMADFPDVRWFLVGDDGQHDPQLYAEAARSFPGRVRAIAIRTLSRAERGRSWGKNRTVAQEQPASATPVVSGRDGITLLRALGDLPDADS